MTKVKYLLLFSLISLYGLAQQHYDRITPLRSNPVLTDIVKRHAVDKIGPPPPHPIKVLKLPFLDDFSKPSSFPDTSLWVSGGGVFINTTYPICPVTLGVATFDGVDGRGLPYDPTSPTAGGSPADTLTSQFIGLGTNTPNDSIYFSFYWESAGIDSFSAPKQIDSLVLEFSNGSTWNRVWYHLGYAPIKPDTGFHCVIIPVISTQYLVNSFQFRFRSYACTAGNLDHWHIDEVYLNRFRNNHDTVHSDVAFVYESQSMLKNYEYMPWEQFTATDVRDTMHLFERNNDTIPTNMLFNYYTVGPTDTTYSGGSNNMWPFFRQGYWDYQPHTRPPLNFRYVPLAGPATWTITYDMSASPDIDNWNDTLRFAQTFSDFYAYDDGSAEANYSVIPAPVIGPPPVTLAEQITLNKPDTLLGVQMFFNYVLANSTNVTFRLMVWKDGGGQPGTVLYEDTNLYNPYYDSLDHFVYYKFLFPQTVSGTIYVGLIQTSGDTINIGFDLNNVHSDKIFYNVGYGWNYSSFPGSIMMRPVLGKTSINAVNEVQNSLKPAITLYPNPAKDMVTFSEAMLPKTVVQVYGSDGRLYYEDNNFSGTSLSTSNLPVGFYIIRIKPKDGIEQFKKLLISR